VAMRQAALVSDESALEACLRRCAIQIDDLYLFTFICMCIIGVELMLELSSSHCTQSISQEAASVLRLVSALTNHHVLSSPSADVSSLCIHSSYCTLITISVNYQVE